MSSGLSVNDVVQTTISLTAAPANYQNFAAACLAGPSDVIDVSQRRRQYANLNGVLADFGSTTPEALWATEYFGQSVQPSILYIARWAQSATSGVLHGAELTPTQRLMANFTVITSGAFYVAVDGVPYAITGLNFSAATNLNGVAAALQTALRNAGALNCLVTWDASNLRFNIESGTTGVLSSLSYARAPTAIGTFTFSAQPTVNAILTLNASTMTFVASGATSAQCNIGSTLPNTLQNLVTALNASTDTQISKNTYSTDGVSKLFAVCDTPGTGGNTFTLVASVTPASNATVSGATMAGGTGTDVSVLLGLSLTPNSTGAYASPPVQGIAAETLLSCIETVRGMFSDFYWMAAVPPVNSLIADADNIAVAGYIQAATPWTVYAITSQNTNEENNAQTSTLGDILNSSDYDRTLMEFSSTNPYAVASLIALFATVNYDGSNTTITGKFKLQPGVIPEILTETQNATLQGRNINVYAQYQNGVAITQQATMCNGTFIDSRVNADWLASSIQTDVFNFLRSLKTKLPQTDAGMSLLKNVMTKRLQQAVVNGYIAPGVWNADGVGIVNNGDFLPLGYYVYMALVATQSETSRQLRQAMPAQIIAKEAGAVHSANISILVNP